MEFYYNTKETRVEIKERVSLEVELYAMRVLIKGGVWNEEWLFEELYLKGDAPVRIIHALKKQKSTIDRLTLRSATQSLKKHIEKPGPQYRIQLRVLALIFRVVHCVWTIDAILVSVCYKLN